MALQASCRPWLPSKAVDQCDVLHDARAVTEECDGIGLLPRSRVFGAASDAIVG
jgi:hypothetical protein